MLTVFKSVGFAGRSEIPLRLKAMLDLTTDREQGKEGRKEGRKKRTEKKRKGKKRKEKKRKENTKNEKRKNEMKWDSVTYLHFLPLY